MKKALITSAFCILVGLLTVLVFYVTFDITSAEKIDWIEGHCQISPNKKWAVYIKSTSTSDSNKSYSKILVFDTAKYPNLKETGDIPTLSQKNNPTASYLLPIQFYARVTNFDWGPDSNYVVIKQGPLNTKPPLSYKVDFTTFSLNEIKF